MAAALFWVLSRAGFCSQSSVSLGSVGVFSCEGFARWLFRDGSQLPADARIVAGLSATVEPPSGTAADQVTIAARALLGSSIAPEVYVVRDSTARRTPIVATAAGNGRLAVAQGLKAGELVVTSGAVSLRDGARVTYR